MPEDWKEAVLDTGLIERIPYELCVLVALRKAIRRREIWIEGGNIWRNPEDDLPPDFEENRDVHYEALSKPRDPQAFIADLQKRHAEALKRLNQALKKGTTGGVKITKKKGEPWISVPPVAKQPEPTNLKALKEEISRRWGVIDLLNLIKDVDHVTGFTSGFSSVASRTITDPDVLRRRLLLCLYGLGTNVGIKRGADGIAAAADAEGDVDTRADSEAALRRTRRLFINRDNLRAAIRTVNKDICYGKAGDLTDDDKEHVEVSALALHLVQAAIAYLNTIMIQIVLADPQWQKKLTEEDQRGLSALFWTHLNLYGRFELDMSNYLDLGVEGHGEA